MSYLVQITTRYETDTTELSGSTWTVGDSVYLDSDTLVATNNSSNGLTALGALSGVIGYVQETPDLNVSGDRMVIRMVEDDDLFSPLLDLLRAQTI